MPGWRAAPLLLLAALAAPAVAHGTGSPGSLASPLLRPGDSFSLVADGTGTYAVHCHLHGNMTATLTVLPPLDPMAMSATTHEVDLVDDAFRDSSTGGPATTVHAGDTVVWRNVGNDTHDVHLTPASAAGADNGSFEAWVLAGLGVTLVAIFAIARRH